MHACLENDQKIIWSLELQPFILQTQPVRSSVTNREVHIKSTTQPVGCILRDRRIGLQSFSF